MNEIVCTLSEDTRRQRREELRRGLFCEVASRTVTEHGVEIRFRRTDNLHQLADYIAFESRCCAFLRFEMIVESRSELATLRLTGPEGTREFVGHWFEAPRPGS